MDEDVDALIQQCNIQHLNELSYFASRNSRNDIYHIDKYLKSLGHTITNNERALLKTQDSVVIGRKYIVCRDRNYLFIAPYVETKNFSKDFKEKMRKLKIEPKLRGYLAFDAEAVEFLSLLFS
jgi:tRNA(Ile)-lysidine synthase